MYGVHLLFLSPSVIPTNTMRREPLWYLGRIRVNPKTISQALIYIWELELGIPAPRNPVGFPENVDVNFTNSFKWISFKVLKDVGFITGQQRVRALRLCACVRATAPLPP